MQLVDALREASLPTLETEVLLADVLGTERAWILAHGEKKLSDIEISHFHSKVARRKNSEPVAYILGKKEFYGRPFTVTPDVLIPRSETEEFVGEILGHLSDKQERMTEVDTNVVAFIRKFKEGTPEILVDIGTGSGCIAITLASETELPVIATDISGSALEIAKENAKRLNVTDRIAFHEGNLLEPLENMNKPFFLVSNPPYVPDTETPMKDVVEYEPHVAFYAGPEGMNILTPLVKQAKSHPFCLGIALECRTFQAEKLSEIL